MKKPTSNRFLAGMLLIAVGIVFLLHQMELISMNIGEIASKGWPVILIVFAARSLIYQQKHVKSWTPFFLWNAGIIAVACYFLGHNFGIITISFGEMIRYAIPVVLILLGLSFVFRRHVPQSPPADRPEPPVHPFEPNPDPFHGMAPPSPDVFQTYGPLGPLNPPDPSPKPNNEAGGVHSEQPTPLINLKKPPQAEPEDTDSGQPFRTKREWRIHNRELAKQWRENRDVNKSIHEQIGQTTKQHWNHDWSANTGGDTVNKSGFIGDLHLGQDFWELKPMNVSQFIGDTILDLTKAQIAYGETKIHVSSFIGDIKIFVPNDPEIGVSVVSSSFLGDIDMLDQKQGGFLKNLNAGTPQYVDADKKIRIMISTFIGDIKIARVG